MNKKHIALILASSMIIFASCSNNKEVNDTIIIDDNTIILDEDNKQKEDLNVVDDEEDDINKVNSKLDGLKYKEELVSKRPIVVSIDNHPKARWQAGISEAEIVYEVEAEAPYTRYLAVFQTKEPKLIGPVRSARPYMIYLALNYDSIFAHVGGSEDAFAKIKTLSVADIDGLYSSNMWRYNKTNKYAPHNLYTDIASLRKDADGKGYRTDAEYAGYKFNDTDTDLISEELASYIKLTYNDYNTTEYKYDEENKNYIRYKDGVKHIDENNNEQITAKNIIVYKADKKVLDNEGRLYLGVVGQGEGYYITNGKVIDITWKKTTEKSETAFYYGDEELTLNPGNTWIQIINKSTIVQFTN